jgi:hypothetical protein
MLSDKIITNKIYLYGGVLHKVKKIQKTKNKIFLQSMMDMSDVILPLSGSEILLSRVYTIGEVAKIVERRPDTIRKYERSGLIPKPSVAGVSYPSYKNWRFYKFDDVHEILSFFSKRTPGRPMKQASPEVVVENNIKFLNQKVKLVNRSVLNARAGS